MALEKETVKENDAPETVRGISALVSENYLNGVNLALSILKENLKAFNTQVDQLLNLQQDYIKTGQEFYKKNPLATLWNGNPGALNSKVDSILDSIVDFQKDYVKLVRSASDKVTKETLKLTQNKERQSSVNDLEPICIFLTTYKIERPDEKEIEKVVDVFLSDFMIIKTLNPLVRVFIGRWRSEISKKSKDRIIRLVDNLKSVEGICSVTHSFTWTNILKQQELTWKAWREVIS